MRIGGMEQFLDQFYGPINIAEENIMAQVDLRITDATKDFQKVMFENTQKVCDQQQQMEKTTHEKFAQMIEKAQVNIHQRFLGDAREFYAQFPGENKNLDLMEKTIYENVQMETEKQMNH